MIFKKYSTNNSYIMFNFVKLFKHKILQVKK